ncbi:hypothetical protein CMI48_04200 [Candidatus Pacearchaeota archaeon]|nr:hypothetical protein [Candidatus Pacearchaeota archaeon]
MLHSKLQGVKRFSFPFDEREIPKNGIYVLFEKGEGGHGGDRIVRVGTHTGLDQLRSRLFQHFLNENKDRSIFRKNIGRSLLHKEGDLFLASWELDLTTRDAKEQHESSVDLDRQREVEKQVTAYIQDHFSFVVFPIEEKERRMDVESKIISTVSLCNGCGPSEGWLGGSSPKEKIRKSGLWLVNELWKTPLSEEEMKELSSLLGSGKF